MLGGKAIAAGSDGCVFDGVFDRDGTFTKDPDVVTKIYIPERKDVAENEWKAMELVRDATKNRGVVIANAPPHPVERIPPEAWENSKIGHACQDLRRLPPGTRGITGLEIPRINGTLLSLEDEALARRKDLVLTGDSFSEITEAIHGMHCDRLVHMDLAARNIFYAMTYDGVVKLLLGDFGNTFKIGDDIDTRVQTYLKRYEINHPDSFLACTKIDGVHPFAIALMILYNALLEGKPAYEALLKNIRDNDYLHKTVSIAEATWPVRVLRDLTAREPSIKTEVDAFVGVLATKLKNIIGIFASPGRRYEDIDDAGVASIRRTIQNTLRRSDKCLLHLMILIYQKGALTPNGVATLTSTWFPPQSVKGGKKQRGGAGMPPSAENLESVFKQPDPVLQNDVASSSPDSFPSVIEGLAQLDGGANKTTKTRRKRVKMSRRR